MDEFLFVLEQTLGHRAHSRNLERVLEAESDFRAERFHIEFDPRGWERLPVMRNWSFRASWKARRWLDSRIRQQRPAAIFIHTQVASLLARGIMARIPTVLSMDATPAAFDQIGRAYSHAPSHPVVEAAKRALNRRSFAAAAGLVTWSSWAADSLRHDYAVPAEATRVIPPGVDLELFRPLERKAGPSRRLLFVGGDLERKGGLDLIAAMALLPPQVELDIVTASPAPPIPPGVTARVHHNLEPQSPELVHLFREADIFVLPTRGECFGQAIVEAMACSLPVVSTPVGAIPELVREGDNGMLVTPGSPADLARALRVLLDDRARRMAMGDAGLQMARRDHDMRRNNRAILAFMREVAARPVREVAPA